VIVIGSISDKPGPEKFSSPIFEKKIKPVDGMAFRTFLPRFFLIKNIFVAIGQWSKVSLWHL
jgi:hypothetical protein